MSRVRRLFVFISICLLLFSCKNVERASRKPIEGKKTTFLLQQVKNNMFNFKTLAVKASVIFKQNDKKNSFKASVRIQKDSAIWISISSLRLEAARILILKDTVKMLNRLNKEYFIGDYSYINKKFNINLDFNTIQRLIVGNPMEFEEDDKLKFGIDQNNYYLGNLKKGRATKVEDKPARAERKKEEIVSLWLNAENYKLVKFILSDEGAKNFIHGNYPEHFEIDNQLFPKQFNLDFQTAKPANLQIEYSRLSLDKVLTYPFKVSSKYEKIAL